MNRQLPRWRKRQVYPHTKGADWPHNILFDFDGYNRHGWSGILGAVVGCTVNHASGKRTRRVAHTHWHRTCFKLDSVFCIARARRADHHAKPRKGVVHGGIGTRYNTTITDVLVINMWTLTRFWSKVIGYSYFISRQLLV